MIDGLPPMFNYMDLSIICQVTRWMNYWLCWFRIINFLSSNGCEINRKFPFSVYFLVWYCHLKIRRSANNWWSNSWTNFKIKILNFLQFQIENYFELNSLTIFPSEISVKNLYCCLRKLSKYYLGLSHCFQKTETLWINILLKFSSWKDLKNHPCEFNHLWVTNIIIAFWRLQRNVRAKTLKLRLPVLPQKYRVD